MRQRDLGTYVWYVCVSPPTTRGSASHSRELLHQCLSTTAEKGRSCNQALPLALHLSEGSVPYEANVGANQFTYFVCTHLGGHFSRLPFVTPDQIKAARQIKKLLTGRLESPVSTYPVFPGMHTAKRPRGGGREKGTPR